MNHACLLAMFIFGAALFPITLAVCTETIVKGASGQLKTMLIMVSGASLIMPSCYFGVYWWFTMSKM